MSHSHSAAGAHLGQPATIAAPLDSDTTGLLPSETDVANVASPLAGDLAGDDPTGGAAPGTSPTAIPDAAASNEPAETPLHQSGPRNDNGLRADSEPRILLKCAAKRNLFYDLDYCWRRRGFGRCFDWPLQ